MNVTARCSFGHDHERLIFLGTPAIAVPTLEALAASPLRPVGVITEPDKPIGRRLIVTPSQVAQAADEHALPVFKPTTPAELDAVVRALAPTVGCVVAYGHLLRPNVLDIPHHGFVNCHFSLLPRYRGATPIQAALLAGDEQTGVTLMRLDATLDTGPLIGHATLSITPTDTAGSLGAQLAQQSAALANALIPAYITGEAMPVPQAVTATGPTKRLTKAAGQIDWSQPVRQLDRFIRAMTPWPSAWTEQADQRIIIRLAHVEREQLVLDQVQVAGRRVITGSEFARGYPAALTALIKTGTVAPLI